VNAGLRVMEGRFMAIEPAFAVPKGHSAGLRYLKTFVEELKASRRRRRCAAGHLDRGIPLTRPQRRPAELIASSSTA
jgi:hypothetical protein